MDYENNPVYQRAIARRMAIDPSQRAVITTGDIDAAAAAEEQARNIQAEKFGAGMSAEARRQALDEMAFNDKLATARAQLGMTSASQQRLQRQAQMANLVGMGNAVLTGIRGYNAVQDAKRIAEQNKEIVNAINARADAAVAHADRVTGELAAMRQRAEEMGQEMAAAQEEQRKTVAGNSMRLIMLYMHGAGQLMSVDSEGHPAAASPSIAPLAPANDRTSLLSPVEPVGGWDQTLAPDYRTTRKALATPLM